MSGCELHDQPDRGCAACRRAPHVGHLKASTDPYGLPAVEHLPDEPGVARPEGYGTDLTHWPMLTPDGTPYVAVGSRRRTALLAVGYRDA